MLKSKLENYYPNNWEGSVTFTNVEVELSPNSVEYETVKTGMIRRTIKRITRVQNPELYGYFLLQKAEYQSRGVSTTIVERYHDTAECNIPSILKTNLDWRIVRRCKFGKGVSFSPYASYANRYSNRYGLDRAMIIADVLVGKEYNTNTTCTLPPYPYDTTLGNGDNVYVKFYDNEFYPKYVIYYRDR